MPTLGTYNLTLADLAQQTDPMGGIAEIINIMSQTNEMLEDIVWQPCNDGTSHQDTIATGLPQGAWVRYNVGNAPAKGSTANIRAQTGILEMPIVIDRRLAQRRGMDKVSRVRTNQFKLGAEGLAQQMATALIYEQETVNPTAITGLAAHYSTVNTATAASAENVIDGGGTGSDNLSFWLVQWDENKISGLLPEGYSAGIQRRDKGIVDVVDSTGIAGATFEAYKEILEFAGGLMVKDWRYGVRVCNVDVSNLRTESGAADIWKLVAQMLERMPSGSGKKAIYANGTFKTWARVQALNKSAYQTTFETVAGKSVMMIDGIPVRRVDALVNTEARVV